MFWILYPILFRQPIWISPQNFGIKVFVSGYFVFCCLQQIEKFSTFIESFFTFVYVIRIKFAKSTSCKPNSLKMKRNSMSCKHIRFTNKKHMNDYYEQIHRGSMHVMTKHLHIYGTFLNNWLNLWYKRHKVSEVPNSFSSELFLNSVGIFGSNISKSVQMCPNYHRVWKFFMLHSTLGVTHISGLDFSWLLVILHRSMGTRWLKS